VVDSSVSPLAEDEINITFLPITNWKVNKDSTAYYKITPNDQNSMSKLSNWDWIGLYRSDFMSIDEHITYIWANPKPSPQTQSSSSSSSSSSDDDRSNIRAQQNRNHTNRQHLYSVTFSDQNLLIADRYRLVYVTQDGNVLGISEPFEVNY
jgi:hypothetical protein